MTSVGGIELNGLSKRYGETFAVREVSLAVAPSSYVVLLGPSGSGKTTLLSMIGGFTPPSSGQVLLDGADVTHLEPADRPTATVFQDYALFPHMSVADNVGFGLSVRGMARDAVAARVAEELALVGLDGFGPRRITDMSGGQRQRIALARALVTDPQILLLDEPLGALDLNLRRQMQDELRRLQRREGRSFLHVTHDQDEAMAIADVIVIMRDGRIEDHGPPERVYSRPRTRFSARFMGDSNILDAVPRDGVADTVLGRLPVAGTGTGGLSIRPEMLGFRPREGAVELPGAQIEERQFQGPTVRVRARCGGILLTLSVPQADLPLTPDAPLYLQPGGATALEGEPA